MEWQYEYWFASIQHLSCKKKCFLRTMFDTAKTIFNIEEKRLQQLKYLTDKEITSILQAQKGRDVQKEYECLQTHKIHIIFYFSEEYPEKLKHIPSPPYAIYVKGKLPDKAKKTVAIVGARGCTPYGEEMAIAFAQRLAQAGVQVISGMARGIDGAAHRGTLNAKGSTYAVLGCGADICYPREHIGLYTDIQKDGGILSEYPPRTPPLPANFPARNRIISGLSDIVLVMEARQRSGSLITADMALEQGKDVYALPGPVTSALSQGCNALIKQGAGILLSVEELLLDMDVFVRKISKISDKNKIMLETPEHMVYSCVDLSPKNVSQITDETKLHSAKVLEVLTELQLKGCIREISRHFYVRVGECPIK